MNTLPRTLTVQILADLDTYQRLRCQWRDLICSTRKNELTAAHHLLYLILLGKDWRKGFTCITNKRKLDNGAYYGWALFRAMAALHLPSREAELLAPFDGIITPPMLEQVRARTPIVTPYAYRPDQFTPTSFPFDAYSLTASSSTALEERRSLDA